MKLNKQLTLIATLLVAGITIPTLASADTVLAPGSAWEYMITDNSTPAPGGDPTWATHLGDGWAVGNAPFGNVDSCYGSICDFNYATYWPVNDLAWVRKGVDFSGFDITTAAWNLGVDNGYALYVNGSLVAADNAEGYTYRWEYNGTFGSLLHPGTNIIAVALEDHGGLTAFDMQITAAPVPEPETYALLLAGLGIVGFIARRRA